MKIVSIKSWAALAGLIFLLTSCQKEIEGVNTSPAVPVSQKPKLGTTWTYNYSTYYPNGSLAASSILTHKAKTEETLGGEKWLNIVDTDTDTTVYYLNIKTGGLYQFANSSANLFCKDPATINETYTSFNNGAMEDFTVKDTNLLLPTGIGDVPANYYEGVKNGDLIDLLWYNRNAWIVRRIVYRRYPPPSFLYYRFSTLYIKSMVY